MPISNERRRGRYREMEALRKRVPRSLCVRCKRNEGVHPGLPSGFKGGCVCGPCQMAVIEQHREEQWAAAQAGRAKKRA